MRTLITSSGQTRMTGWTLSRTNTRRNGQKPLSGIAAISLAPQEVAKLVRIDPSPVKYRCTTQHQEEQETHRSNKLLFQPINASGLLIKLQNLQKFVIC